MPEIVGRVLRASTTGFDCGRSNDEGIDDLTFGAFVKVDVQQDGTVYAIGLIHTIRIDDDPLVRQLAMAGTMNSSTLVDQRRNRMVPVELGVLNVGYSMQGEMIHSLPPRPPLTLSDVVPCDRREIYQFTQRVDFFRIVLNASEVPSDDLLAAAIRYASWSYSEEEVYGFLTRCGREVARLLNRDVARLSHLLALIKPQFTD